ncbi:hypothetical protein [Bacillus sp. JJ722]
MLLLLATAAQLFQFAANLILLARDRTGKHLYMEEYSVKGAAIND